MGSRGAAVAELAPLAVRPRLLGTQNPAFPCHVLCEVVSSPVPSAHLSGPRSQGCSPLLPTHLSAVGKGVAHHGAPLRFAWLSARYSLVGSPQPVG